MTKEKKIVKCDICGIKVDTKEPLCLNCALFFNKLSYLSPTTVQQLEYGNPSKIIEFLNLRLQDGRISSTAKNTIKRFLKGELA